MTDTQIQTLPTTGYLRLPSIIGDSKAEPPIPAIIPVSKSSWYSGVRAGRYPKPVKISPRCVAWPVNDILQLVEEMAGAA